MGKLVIKKNPDAIEDEKIVAAEPGQEIVSPGENAAEEAPGAAVKTKARVSVRKKTASYDEPPAPIPSGTAHKADAAGEPEAAEEPVGTDDETGLREAPAEESAPAEETPAEETPAEETPAGEPEAAEEPVEADEDTDYFDDTYDDDAEAALRGEIPADDMYAPADDASDETRPAEADAQDAEPAEPEFDKEKIIHDYKRFKGEINYKVDRFEPGLDEGLTTEQYRTRCTQYLFNDTRRDQSKSYLSIFVGNICTLFNLLALLATIALIISGTTRISNYLVVLVTACNIFLGIFWEIRSKNAINKLSMLSAKTVKVVRDGDEQEVNVKDVVLDDVVLLELGSQVPVDCVLAEGEVEVNESLLTGESVSVKKEVGDTVYAGSYISSGNGKFRADKVGEETYISKLTVKAKKYKRPNSELMNSTKLIIRIVAILIIPIAIGIFIVSFRNAEGTTAAFIFSGDVNFAIQKTCTVVIGMIPSGMILLTSIAMSLGVIRLTRQNTLVQDLYSLEMLARVNVLCLDKTGTITDGNMQVKDVMILDTPKGCTIDEVMGSMLKALDDNNQTSRALYNHFGFSDRLNATNRIPFSSQRKLSAVSFEDHGTYVFGAPEFVLNPCPAKIERIVKQYAHMGMRVIVLAHSNNAIAGDRLPSGLKPLAIITIEDNVREEAVKTLKWFKENDVDVKVISGDNPITVSEVARRAGIDGADKFISLEGFNDREVEAAANQYTVFGRVSPEQKAVLIRSLKGNGNTVAMTGDGVNDILAMKEADCAIALASGSDAAMNVSNLVLMDSNFNSMPKIVAEGRRVINNIKNSSSLYFMKTLFTTILATICIIMGQPYLFLPENILLLEFIVIGCGSFFLSLQPNNERVHGKFMSHVMSRSLSGAITMILCVMTMYVMGNVIFTDLFGDSYKAMCMIVLTFSALVMLFRICSPFNVYRGIMYVVLFAVAIAAFAIPFIAEMLYEGWGDIDWDYSKIITVIVIVALAFPFSQLAVKISEILIPSSVKDVKEVKTKNQP